MASDTPPPLPSQVFERVVQLSGTDGRLVLWLGGVFAVLAAVRHDAIGAIAGVVAAGAGAIELHGSTVLRHGNPGGVALLIRAQYLLLATILLYCAARIQAFDAQALEAEVARQLEQWTSSGFTEEQLRYIFPRIYHISYAVLGFAALIYQGLMVRYYVRSRTAIEQALSGIA